MQSKLLKASKDSRAAENQRPVGTIDPLGWVHCRIPGPTPEGGLRDPGSPVDKGRLIGAFLIPVRPFVFLFLPGKPALGLKQAGVARKKARGMFSGIPRA